MNYSPGSVCTVNGNCDLMQDKDKGAFMWRKCVIVKRCKSGLLQVALADNPKAVNSFAEYNLSPWDRTTFERLNRVFGSGNGRLSQEAMAELEVEWAKARAEEAELRMEQLSQSEHDDEGLK